MMDPDHKLLYYYIPEAVVISDPLTGRILDCNNAAEKLTGRSRSEIIGMQQAGLHSGTEEGSYANFTELLKKGHVENYKAEILTKQGEHISVVINAFHAKDNNRNVTIQIMTRDAAKSPPTEPMSPTEQRLRNALDSLQDMMVMVDLDFNITDLNEPMLATTNLPNKKAALGRKCYEALRYRKETCPDCTVVQVFQTKQPASRISKIAAESTESVKYVEIHAHPLLDDKGNLVGALQYHRDITQRSQAEEALAMAEQRFKDLTESTKDWVWEVDEKGIYTYASPQVNDLLGYSVNEILGKTPFDFMSAEEVERAGKTFRERFSNRHPIYSLENSKHHKDGHCVSLETNGMPVFDSEGNFKGYRGIDAECTQHKHIDEIVRHSEEKFRTLAENTNDIVYSATEEGMITYIGPQVVRYGISPSEATSKCLLDFILPEDREKVLVDLKRCLSTGESFPTEFRIADKQGGVHWVEDVGKPQRNESGAVVGIAGVLRDITERKRGEEALRKREEEYSSLVELSPYGIVLLKGEKVVFANHQAYDMFGFDKAEYGSESIKEVLAANLAEVLKEMSEEEKLSVMDSLSKAAKGESRHFTYQLPLRRKSGEQIWVEVTTNPVQYKGEAVELSFLRDITARKKAEAALHESEEIFRILIEHSSDAIAILNSDGTIRYESPSVERVLGYKAGELVGKNIFDLIHPEERHNAVVSFGAFLGNPGGTLYTEARYLHKDSSWRWIDGIGRNYLHDPKIKGIIVNYRDTTGRRRAEQALVESEAKYRTLVEQLLEGVVIAQDNPIRLVFANRGMATMLGYSVEELISLTPDEITKLVQPDDQDLFFSRFGDRIHGKPVPGSYEFGGVKKDGTEIWLAISSQRIEYLGQPAVFAIFRDVTERRRIDQALKKSEQLFRAVVENSSDTVSILDTNGVIMYSSPSVEKLLGYRPAERIGLNALHEVHPDDQQQLRATLIADMQSPPECPRTVEYRQKHKDGSWRTVESIGRLLVIDGIVSGIVVNSHDVTQRKQSEEAFRERVQDYSSLLELSPDGVVLIRGEDVIFANRRLYEMFGFDPAKYTEEDIKSALVASFADMLNEMRADDRVQMLESLSNVGEGLVQRFEYQVWLKRKSGERIWVEVSTSPLQYKGEMVELSFMRDISKRKRAEEALREHEQEYHSLLELSPDGVVLIKGEDVIFANRRCYEMFGFDPVKYTEEDIKSALVASFADMLNEMRADDRVQMLESLSNVGEGLVQRFDYQVRLKRASGERIWGEVSTSPFQYKGEMVELSFMRDINKRKQAEEALREHEREYHSLLELSPDGVVLIRGEDVIFANRRCYEMFGFDRSKYTEEDIRNALAASFAEMLNEMDEKERAQMMESLSNVGEGLVQRFEYQVPLKRSSGERIWVEVSTSPFQYKGEMVELSLLRDMSARQRRRSGSSN